MLAEINNVIINIRFKIIGDAAAAANLLFEKAVAWLKKRNIEAMDGPINFGEKEKYWGLLVQGFDKDTVYGQNYHLEYYNKLFEN